MAENVTNELLFEQLRLIRGELADLKSGLQRVEGRLGSMESINVALVQTDARHEVDFIAIRQRLDRIEQRLELRD